MFGSAALQSRRSPPQGGGAVWLGQRRPDDAAVLVELHAQTPDPFL